MTNPEDQFAFHAGIKLVPYRVRRNCHIPTSTTAICVKCCYKRRRKQQLARLRATSGVGPSTAFPNAWFDGATPPDSRDARLKTSPQTFFGTDLMCRKTCVTRVVC